MEGINQGPMLFFFKDKRNKMIEKKKKIRCMGIRKKQYFRSHYSRILIMTEYPTRS